MPDMPDKISDFSHAPRVNGGRFVPTLPAPLRLCGRLRAGLLVGQSLVLATVIASSPAAAQPRGGASDVREADATQVDAAQVDAAQVDAAQVDAAQDGNEIDRFMKRVIDNRDASWRRLGDFILRETSTFELRTPSGIPRSGFRREYEWYVREGVAVRSPVRFDGVEIAEAGRRDFEADWMREEAQRRRQRASRPRTVSLREREGAVAVAIARAWGAEVSERLRRRIAADANLLGDEAAAVALNTGAILEELGGVDQVGFGTAATRTGDLMAMLDTGRLTATEAGRAIRRPLANLVDRLDPARSDALERFVELAERGARVALDARDLAPYLERAARQLEGRGRREVAARLDAIRSGLVTGAGSGETGAGGDTDGAALLDASRLEPRFIAESYYFTEFEFEPGSYYFAGRETVAGREVVRIEHYPPGRVHEEHDARISRISRGFNKTSLLTVWVDPEVHQIVKYTFDNPGLGFLRFRWLARVDGLEASMEMAPVGDVWMPARMTMSGRVTTALGEFDATFTWEFFDYREAETGARLIDPGSPR